MKNRLDMLKGYFSENNKISIVLFYFIVFIFMLMAIPKASVAEIWLCFFISAVTLFILLKIKKKHENFSVLLCVMLWYFLGVIQPVWSIMKPENVWLYFITEDMLMDSKLRMSHIMYLSIYYIVLIAAVFAAYKCVDYLQNKKRAGAETHREVFVNPYIIAIVFATLDAAVQYTLGLGNGETKITTMIPHASIFIYLERIIRLVVWVCTLDCAIHKYRESRIEKCITNVMIITLIFSASGIILGQHNPLVMYIGQVFYLLFLLYGDDIKEKIGHRIIYFVALGVIVAVLLYVMLFITNIARTGSASGIKFFSYLFNRITGISDGMTVVNYISNNGETLPIVNYFLQLLKIDSAYPISYFYVDTVIGIPHEQIGGFARPAYASGLLYGGIGFSITFAIISGFVCGLADRIAMIKIKKDNDLILPIVMAYLLIQTFWYTVIEGNVDDISTYIFVAVVSLVLMKVMKIRFRYK